MFEVLAMQLPAKKRGFQQCEKFYLRRDGCTAKISRMDRLPYFLIIVLCDCTLTYFGKRVFCKVKCVLLKNKLAPCPTTGMSKTPSTYSSRSDKERKISGGRDFSRRMETSSAIEKQKLARIKMLSRLVTFTKFNLIF